MMYSKTLTGIFRRLAAVLSAGVLFFPSCSVLDMLELREADPSAVSSQTISETTEAPPPSAEEPEETELRVEETAAAPDTEIIQETEAAPISEAEISPDALEWIAGYEARFGEGSTDEILMTPDEIADYNRRIVEGCSTVVDIAAVPESIPGEEVRGKLLIEIPAMEYYDDDGNRFPWDPVAENAARDTVPDTVTPKTAVVTARCDMKSLPTEYGMYEGKDRFYSKIQLTELIVGMPVWVLHESKDGAFLFVQSYYYEGWIPSEAAALCEDDVFEMFCAPDRYVTVTAPKVEWGDVTLDMGVVLPLIEKLDNGDFSVILPGRGEDGAYLWVGAGLSRADAAEGSLPYTMKNFYAQAFAFLGTPYGWGGAKGGVDCSGFVCAVFRSFGIRLPRDTKDQKDWAGGVRGTEGLSLAEITASLPDSRFPLSLYSPGHVMLYLGEKDGEAYVIHAPQGGDMVRVAAIEASRTIISVVEMK